MPETSSYPLETSTILRSLPGLNLFLLPDAPRFTIIEVSESYNAATFTRREDLLGKGIFEAFPDNPDDPEQHLETELQTLLQRVIAEKATLELETVKYDLIVPETGNMETFYWSAKNTPLLDENGEVAFIMHTVKNITAEMLLKLKYEQNHALLQKNEQHYHSLFHHNPDAVFSFDLEGNFLSANQAMADLAECTLEEILRMSFIPLVAPEDLEKVLHHFSEAAKGNQQRYEARLVTTKGRRGIVNVTNLPIIVNNKIVGVYGIAKDITDYVRTQQELLLSKQKFEKIAQVSNDALWDWNLLTNEVNRAGKTFIDLFGKTLTVSPLSDNWMNLIHPDDLQMVRDRFENHIKNPETQHFEEMYRVRKINGSYAYIIDRGYIMRDETGKAVHIYGATKDISNHKISEAEREQLIKKLIRSNIGLKQFSYITSHNLRAPVANLISLGKLINEDRIEDPTTRSLLQKYKQTADKLNENVNDLLEILLIKNNHEIAEKPVEIDRIFQQVTASIENYITENGANIQTDFSAGNVVVFNPGYLHSILLNLLTNAIKYRSPDRPLKINVYTRKKSGHLYLYFSDNGLGINMEKYGNRVFGLYQKFHDHPDSKGLGLHIVASQVKAMSGKISLESEVNAGSTFTIKFKNK